MSKVTCARLQTSVYVSGCGDLGTVFPSQSKTLEGLDMKTSEPGLSIRFMYRGIKKSLVVPLANVIFMEVIDEEPETAKIRPAKAS